MLNKIFVFIFFILSSYFSFSQIDKHFSLINKSEKNVDLLYNNQQNNIIKFQIELFRKWHVLKNENSVILRFPQEKNNSHEICIFSDSISIHKNIVSKSISDTVKTINYRTNIEYIKDDKDIIDQKNIFDTIFFNFSNADITVIRQGPRCNDSGINSVKFKTQSGFIHFNYMNNIKIFEVDLNNDKINEIYIINFSCCDGKLKIYKIR